MDNQILKSEHWKDEKGMPAGGCTYAPGLCISWQHGPLGTGDRRQEPNGCFVETVIRAAIDRLEHYQSTAFKSRYNEAALDGLNAALGHLSARTADREKRGVEGTHER